MAKISLKAFRPRAKNMAVVSVEPGRVEYLMLRQKKGQWESEPARTVVFPEEDSLPDTLRRLDICPDGRKDTDLVLFLAKPLYQFARGLYPESLEGDLEKVVRFSLAENLMNDASSAHYFMDAPSLVEGVLKVPVFSMDKDLYLGLSQALSAEAFASFTVAPDSKGYRVLARDLPEPAGAGDGEPRPLVLGRMAAGSRLHLHRLVRGALMDSVEGADGSETMKMLAWTIFGLHGGAEGPPPPVHLFHSPDESPPAPSRKTGLTYVVHGLDKPLVHFFAQSLLDMDKLAGFTSSLRLKRRQVPKSLWMALAVLLAYGCFAFLQFHERAELRAELEGLNARHKALRQKWDPIQARQDKVQAMLDQEKALMERDPDTLSALKLLTLLSERTPQDTYLKQVFLKERKLEITGESGDALQYRSLLTAIDGFEDVQFASTVHHLAQENKDRFVIKVTLNPIKLRDDK
jgi:hypothetical protein